MAKNLIIYYSRKGENYVNGCIKNLAKGNTEIVAEYVQKAVGGDLFEIETVKEYPKDYNGDSSTGGSKVHFCRLFPYLQGPEKYICCLHIGDLCLWVFTQVHIWQRHFQSLKRIEKIFIYRWFFCSQLLQFTVFMHSLGGDFRDICLWKQFLPFLISANPVFSLLQTIFQ